MGVDVNEWKFQTQLEGKQVDSYVTLWDFAGQEEYYPCHQFFFSGDTRQNGSDHSESALILLIFDMEAHEENPVAVKKRLEEWTFSIRSRIPKDKKVPIILIGTHLDKVPKGIIKWVINSTDSADLCLHEVHSYLSELLKDEKVTLATGEAINPVKSFAVDTISGKNTDSVIQFIKGTLPERFYLILQTLV